MGGDVEAGLAVCLVAPFGPAFDHDDGGQPRPVVALREPLDIIAHGDGSCFETIMVVFHGFMASHCRIGMIARLLLPEEEFDIAVQGALIALQSQNMLSAPVDNSVGDGAVTPHGVNGDEGPFNVQQIETSGNGGDFVGRAVHLALAANQMPACGEGADHVKRVLAGRPVAGPAQGPAVDGDNAVQAGLQRRYPCDEAALEGLRIEGGKDGARPIMGRRAIDKG